MSTPTSEFLAAAMTTETIHDSNGRQLVIRRMTALDRLRLFKAVGPILAQNTPYLGMAMLAASVTSIDGVPIPVPATEPQLEFLVAKLGDAGIGAVAEAFAGATVPQVGSETQGN